MFYTTFMDALKEKHYRHVMITRQGKHQRERIKKTYVAKMFFDFYINLFKINLLSF